MKTKYIHLKQGVDLPDISAYNPYKAVIIIESKVQDDWKLQVSDWLVNTGCLYMMAWGCKCSEWDDSVDYANIEAFNYESIPEDKQIMTTWHENDTLSEVFVFSKTNAVHPVMDIDNTLILHICSHENEKLVLHQYDNA